MMRWLQHIAAAIVLLSAVLGRIEPVVITDVELATPVVRPGEFLVVHRAGRWIRPDCIDVSVTAFTTDSLTPPKDHALGEIKMGAPVLERKNLRQSWQVAYTMPWGQASLHELLQYSCFPFFNLWPITIELPPIAFTVLAPDSPKAEPSEK